MVERELPEATFEPVAVLDHSPVPARYVRLSIAAACLMLVALVWVTMLPADDGPGVSNPTAPGSEKPSAIAASRPSVVASPILPGSTPSRAWSYPRVADGTWRVATGRHLVTVDGLLLSFEMPPASSWESRELYMSSDTEGPHDAEAIIIWTTFPSRRSDTVTRTGALFPCIDLLGEPVGRSAADLAGAVSVVAGTDVVSGPSDVTVGGRLAKQVTLFATYSVLDNGLVCYGGFFISWDFDTFGGAFWTNTLPGDTIRVWIVDLDETVLFIEAATHWNASRGVGQEIQRMATRSSSSSTTTPTAGSVLRRAEPRRLSQPDVDDSHTV
jgi:hypothetical protein